MFGIVVFPGSNCDRDVATVTRGILGCPTRLIWYTETDLSGIDVVVLPGGFSYGDYLRCGAIARLAPIMSAIRDHAARGGHVIGICNGFQVLTEAGLLPGALMRNAHMQFVCEPAPLTLCRRNLAWTHQYTSDTITLPIAHGEGNYVCDDATYSELVANNQIVFRYQSNPNGSRDDIAGICNLAGNVLGLMPHPERAAEALLGNTDGLPLWQSIVAHYRAVATV
ncbi:MAG: phosphoribosylformylglycinamidine synthase subunit PurQ [Synechococcaceae cyanobacterium SM2_3_60]|nr:phosphoribosylformylglycinamidine synthase subunit PurQ [Synechococcaceae cyanobacterium SM2_3_60]